MQPRVGEQDKKVRPRVGEQDKKLICQLWCCGDQADPVIPPPSPPLIRKQIAGGIALGAIPLILPDETRVKSPTDKYGRSHLGEISKHPLSMGAPVAKEIQILQEIVLDET